MPKKQVDVGEPHRGWWRSCHCQQWRLASEGTDWRSAWVRLCEALGDNRDADDFEAMILPVGQVPSGGLSAPERVSPTWQQATLFD